MPDHVIYRHPWYAERLSRSRYDYLGEAHASTPEGAIAMAATNDPAFYPDKKMPTAGRSS